MTDGPFVIAAGRVVDGRGSLAAVQEMWASLQTQGARCVELTIDPLSAGWHTPVEPDHFRSGNGPIEAMAHARDLLRDGRADAVLIRGRDHLRSAYSKEERQRLMAIYGPDCSIPEAYTQLAKAFMRLHGLDEDQFRRLADRLFDNYRRTADRLGLDPSLRSDRMATALFRVTDCANPVTDFEGAMILAIASLTPLPFRGGLGEDGTEDSSSRESRNVTTNVPPSPNPSLKGRGVSARRPVRLMGVACARASGDGPAYIEETARYDHLSAACREACEQAGINLRECVFSRQCLLEVYTCFPVVPLAFLIASGTARDVDEIERLLTDIDITVTGGMNLARAAWNNPALNALIAMHERLVAGDATIGVIHGNGGMGYRQGIAILGVR